MRDGLTELQERAEAAEFRVHELTTYPEEWMRNHECVALRLSPRQGRIMGRMLRTEGVFVHKEQLFAAMYTSVDDMPGNPDNCLSVQVTQMNKRLKGTPFRVENRFGFGYRVVRK